MSIITTLINGVVDIEPDADAIEYEGHWYSWGAIGSTRAAVDSLLDKLDLRQGARVAVMIRNKPSTIGAIFSVVAREACLVVINPLLPGAQLSADLKRINVPVIMGEREELEREGVLDVLRSAGTAIIELKPGLQGAQFYPDFEAFRSDSLQISAPGVMIEMLTSGTTGIPKRIPLKRKAFDRSFAEAMIYEKDRNPDDPPKLRPGVDTLLNPLTHIGGLWPLLSTLLAGRRLCLIDKFSVEKWHRAVVTHKPAVISTVPAGLRMILDAGLPKDDLASLKAIRTGAAPCDPSIIREFMKRYSIPVLQNYGATEFAGAIAGWGLKDFYENWEAKLGSVGRIHADVEAEIVDPDTDTPVRPGDVGVLRVRAPQLGNDGNWLKTTDLAVIDEDGYLFIRGRADNAIIRGGFKVHPDEVNAVLEQHPAIREAVVVGIEDNRLGAVPVAALILKSGATEPSDTELRAFCKSHLMPYQVPVTFRFFADVPRTPSLKPALPQVRDLLQTVSASQPD